MLRTLASGLSAIALVAIGIAASTPAQAIPSGTITQNSDETLTVTYSGFSPSPDLAICPTTVALTDCTPAFASYVLSPNVNSGRFTLSTSPATIVGGMDISTGLSGTFSSTTLAAGTYNIVLSTSLGRVAELPNAVIGSGGGSSSTVAAPVVPTLEMNLNSADGTTCTTSASGTQGTWVTLPAADDCTAPVTRTGAVLLGWSTTSDFPVSVAQRQIDNGWGTYEIFNEEGLITAVFIPAGRATFLSGANNLYAIWTK